jgi:type I restriction enzyme S subunit
LASEVKEIYLNFPSKAEQTKIAAFLSAVDEKITQLTQNTNSSANTNKA